MPKPISLASIRCVALALAPLAVASALCGCVKASPPELTLQQLAAGRIPEVHPVSQVEATQAGCRCHIEVTQARQ